MPRLSQGDFLKVKMAFTADRWVEAELNAVEWAISLLIRGEMTVPEGGLTSS